MREWNGCHYCCARGWVRWTHLNIDADRYTCYHHGRTRSLDLSTANWIRVTEDEWFTEANKLQGAL